MELKQAIVTRQSIRAYEDRPIERETLEWMLEAVKAAPTGRNRQTLRFYALADPHRIAEMEKAMRAALQMPEYSLRGAKAFVIVTAQREDTFREVDSACALMNAYYGAMAVGLGACWINQMRGLCDEAPLRTFLRGIGVPDDYVSYGMMALGYPAETPEPKARTSFAVLVE